MKANPHFANIDRPAYELGRLLEKMPADFSRSHPLTPDDRLIAKAARDHAVSANGTLLRGLAALGHVMSVACANEHGAVDADQLEKLGDLINHIAVESQFLQETEWRIREMLES